MMSNGALTLDPVTHEVKVKDETGNETVQTLTSREYALLEALLRRPGAVLSREAIEDKIYAFGEEVESNAVEFIIHNLRKRLVLLILKMSEVWVGKSSKETNPFLTF